MISRRNRAAALVLAVALGGGAGAAAAATSDVSPTGFLVTVRHDVKATPHRVYEALGEIDKWWNGNHGGYFFAGATATTGAGLTPGAAWSTLSSLNGGLVDSELVCFGC